MRCGPGPFALALMTVAGGIALAIGGSTYAQERVFLVGPDGVEVAPPAPVESAPPEAPPASPCDRITCSGVGTCVMTPSGPSCACGSGYRADPVNGLSCIPVQGTPGKVERVKASSAEQRGILERTLGRNLEAEFGRFEAGNFESERGMDFASYLERRLVSHRAGMAVLTIPITVLLMGGGAGMMAASTEEYYDDQSGRFDNRITNTPVYAVGAVCAVGGLATLITGAVLWARDDRQLRRIRRADLSTPVARDSQAPRFAAVVPFTAQRWDGGGLSLLFAF